MAVTKKYLITMLVIAIVAFLAAPNGPLGGMIWPEPHHDEEPTAGQMPFFIVLGIFEALAFGFGIAYWIFGMETSKALFGPGGLGVAAHISVGFVTANFWLHDNLHMINGLNMGGLIVIDYAFHIPLMVAGALIVIAGAKHTNTTM